MPHVVLYIDASVDQCKELIKKRNNVSTYIITSLKLTLKIQVGNHNVFFSDFHIYVITHFTMIKSENNMSHL